MGKKRVAKQSGSSLDKGLLTRAMTKLTKKRVSRAVLHIRATFNNTALSLTEKNGKVLAWSSSGALGFKGAKKGTPFAAAKVGELMGEKAKMIGIKDIDVIIKGVGAGRESALRAFAAKGTTLTSIKDITPVPHNGVRKPKPRRV